MLWRFVFSLCQIWHRDAGVLFPTLFVIHGDASGVGPELYLSKYQLSMSARLFSIACDTALAH